MLICELGLVGTRCTNRKGRFSPKGLGTDDFAHPERSSQLLTPDLVVVLAADGFISFATANFNLSLEFH